MKGAMMSENAGDAKSEMMGEMRNDWICLQKKREHPHGRYPPLPLPRDPP